MRRLRARWTCSGVCSRTINRAVSRGTEAGVASETMTAVPKANGVHHAAGFASSAPGHPSRGPATNGRQRGGGRRQRPDHQPGHRPARDSRLHQHAEHEQRSEHRRRQREREPHGRRDPICSTNPDTTKGTTTRHGVANRNPPNPNASPPVSRARLGS